MDPWYWWKVSCGIARLFGKCKGTTLTKDVHVHDGVKTTVRKVERDGLEVSKTVRRKAL